MTDRRFTHLTESDIAVNRARRIVTQSTAPDVGDYRDGLLFNALQRWWMMHQRLLPNVGVREAFTDAVEAALPHLGIAPVRQPIVERLVCSVRKSEPDVVFAVARGLMVEIGLDPEATVMSQHLTEWAWAIATVESESDREAAAYLATLTRQAVLLIADPDTHSDQREVICTEATTSLRHIAAARHHRDELWIALSHTITDFFGDDEAARVARLSCAVEVLTALADSGGATPTSRV